MEAWNADGGYDGYGSSSILLHSKTETKSLRMGSLCLLIVCMSVTQKPCAMPRLAVPCLGPFRYMQSSWKLAA